jgi:Sec-independent protein translocase protein TatA
MRLGPLELTLGLVALLLAFGAGRLPSVFEQLARALERFGRGPPGPPGVRS